MTDSLTIDAVDYLSWDSDFFKKKIGRYESFAEDDPEATERALIQAQQQGYKLVYLFLPENQPVPATMLARFDAELVDTKLVYARELNEVIEYDNPAIQCYQKNDDLTKLYDLAYQAGKYSRFKIDPHFSEEEFRKLYRHWVDKSIGGVMADEVFVYKEEDDIVGMITLKITENTGIPGILATDNNQRGRGIATAYFDYVLRYLQKKNVPELRITTQKQNVSACRFYEKINCRIISTKCIYHVWL